jgi:hypothetical protein
MSDTVAAIVSAFFIIGITVGIIAVVAISVPWAGRRGDPGTPGDLPDYGPPRPDSQPSDSRRDDAGSDDHPRWPGNADSDFSSR